MSKVSVKRPAAAADEFATDTLPKEIFVRTSAPSVSPAISYAMLTLCVSTSGVILTRSRRVCETTSLQTGFQIPVV